MGQFLISGLATGSSYALVAVALVLVWKATGVLNFAQAEIGLFGAFVAWFAIESTGANYYVAVVGGMIAAAVLAMVLERAVVRPIMGESHFAMLIMTIGLYVTVNSLTTLIWGSAGQTIPSPLHGTLHLGPTLVADVNQIAAIVVGAALTLGLTVFFRSRWGVQMRAIAEDRVTPRLLGVSMGRVVAASWALGALLATVALLFQTQATLLNNTAAADLIVKATVAATIGGFASVSGAYFGGLALGVVETLAGGYISSGDQSAVALVLVVLILLVRPEGIFTRGRARQV